MDLNFVIEQCGNSIYALQALSAVYGAALTFLVVRRIGQKRFASKAAGEEFTSESLKLLRQHQYDAVTELCDSPAYWSKATPQLLMVALANRTRPVAKMRQAVAEAFERDVLAELEYRLSGINTVIKSAPMLGLLGTVVGMIAAFGKIATMQKAGSDPSLLANDISLALITTAIGLIIAIPLIIAISSIQIRISKLQDSVQTQLDPLLEALEAPAARKAVS